MVRRRWGKYEKAGPDRAFGGFSYIAHPRKKKERPGREIRAGSLFKRRKEYRGRESRPSAS